MAEMKLDIRTHRFSRPRRVANRVSALARQHGLNATWTPVFGRELSGQIMGSRSVMDDFLGALLPESRKHKIQVEVQD